MAFHKHSSLLRSPTARVGDGSNGRSSDSDQSPLKPCMAAALQRLQPRILGPSWRQTGVLPSALGYLDTYISPRGKCGGTYDTTVCGRAAAVKTVSHDDLEGAEVHSRG